MASIVHVTDKDMIEFHRLNGNDSFNFWRAGSKMKFTDFKVGDTLFFLAKGSVAKEKRASLDMENAGKSLHAVSIPCGENLVP